MTSSRHHTSRLCTILLSIITGIASTEAGIIYVDGSVMLGAGDGSSWCDGYINLQDALAAAATGDDIRVATGVYYPDRSGVLVTGDRLASFQLASGVTLSGGFAGCGASNPNAQDATLFETILSGDLSGNDGVDFANRTDNSYHVVTYNDPNATGVVLDGFTISGGHADGTGPAGTHTNQGSAIHLRLDSQMCIAGGPTIRNCIVKDNWSADHGAINVHADATLIENCTIRDNHSNAKGGGLLIQSGSATVRNCSFINNTAIREGGGVWTAHNEDPTCALQSQPLIENCTFQDNVSSNQGGGLFVLSGDAIVRETSFVNNFASREGGGAWVAHDLDPIAAPSGFHVFEFCIFTGNRAQSSNNNLGQGGGLHVANGNITVRNSEFTNNISSQAGGGIWLKHCDDPTVCVPVSQPLIEDCIFTGNRSEGLNFGYGGAVWTDFTNLEVRNTSFVDNFAKIQGGATYSQRSNVAYEACEWNSNTSVEGGGLWHGGINTILTVNDSTFINNHADFSGGGLNVYSGSPRISGTTFLANSATTVGGGAHIFQDITLGCDGFCQTCDPGFCEAYITNCVFSLNEATYGGGFANGYAGKSILNNVLFDTNLAIHGGGMFQGGLNGAQEALSGSSLLTDCVFRRNKKLSPFWGGGGLWVRRGSTVLVRCDFLENTHTHNGAGLYVTEEGEADVINCRLLGNKLEGAGRGGGIYIDRQSRLSLTNTLVSGNANVATGGGIAIIDDSSVVISNSTIVGNSVTAPSGGSSLYVDSANVQVTNSILWNGLGGNPPQTISIGATNAQPEILFSIVENGWAGAGNLDVDPQFVNAAGPDGLPGTLDDDLRLSLSSPALDAGNISYLPQDSEDIDGNGDTVEPIPMDLAGESRVYGNGLDLGAYETSVLLCQPGTFSLTGEDPCNPCPEGTSQPNAGAMDCLACTPGTFAATIGLILCDPCPLGTFQSNSGAVNCIDCMSGTFASTTESTFCSPCPSETFQPLPGSSACNACTCDDGNICTSNSCDGVSGSCANDPITGCSIPAASTWSLICLTLLLLIAGTILTSREMRRVP